MRAILGLDHVIILVRDLDAALSQMRRLGFATTPRASHSAAMGTANGTFVLRDGTYVELMTVVDETPLNASLAAIQREREGLVGIAMKTDDARAAAAELASAGLAAGGAAEFSRPVELAEGVREAAFTIARLDPAKTPGAWMFVCQHHTPDVVWRADHLDQQNGTLGLAEVVGIATELDPIEQAYMPIFGTSRVSRTDDGLVLEADGARIAFLTPLAFAARFGQAALDGGPHLAALSLRSQGLERVAEVLRAAGIPFARPKQSARLVVPPVAACRVSLEFVEASTAAA